MKNIERLSPEIIGKIAAGEVVEGPTAAIKELIENSMDAGATAITVEIKDGGISYIRITDNGAGIDAGQIRLAFERHATSKIHKAEDLGHISTLGFRGEALASISAVSKVTCTTRTKNMDHGIRVANEGGMITDLQDAACPEGTTFVIKELFYNTPVRLKFLKKPSYEAGQVGDLLMRMILSRPDISFRFISQGKTVYHSAGDGKLSSAVFCIYGREMLSSMRYIHGNAGGMLVDGYVGIGDLGKGNRNQESFFLNGRLTKNSILSQALEQACRERVMIGHFPVCVLHITMPYELVDVNVHPNKLEVRFQNEQNMYLSLTSIIYDALQDKSPLAHIPEMQLDTAAEAVKENELKSVLIKSDKVPENIPKSFDTEKDSLKVTDLKSTDIPKSVNDQESEKPAVVYQPMEEKTDEQTQKPAYQPIIVTLPEKNATYMQENVSYRNVGESTPIVVNPIVPIDTKNKKSDMQPTPVQQEVQLSDKEEKQCLRIIGVVFNTYILVSYGEKLLFIDQHAAHERLLYDKMKEAYDRHTLCQALLVPQAIGVTPHEASLIEENKQALSEAGFEIEMFDQTTAQVRSIPMVFGQTLHVKALFSDVIEQLQAFRGASTLEKRRTSLMQMACKRAVKGGESLSEASIQDLVEQMIKNGVTPTCPHGRPLIIAVTHYDLDKRFKRVQ